ALRRHACAQHRRDRGDSRAQDSQRGQAQPARRDCARRLRVSASSEPVTIAVSSKERVSGLLLAPAGARACYVLAHGAGAGMTHPFLAAVATGLATRSIATLRYQFPYMEQGS